MAGKRKADAISQAKLQAIGSLLPYQNNARTHPKEQIAQIAASIETFGFVGAIVVRNGVIAKGHGTLAACQLLYAEKKPVYPAPGAAAGVEPYPMGHVPVLDVSGWSDSQFRAFVIADNKIAQASGWQDDLLKLELEELLAEGFDLEVTGFSEDELDALNGAAAGTAPDTSSQLGNLEYRVVVSCKSEQHQAELLARFEAEGLTCQALIS